MEHGQKNFKAVTMFLPSLYTTYANIAIALVKSKQIKRFVIGTELWFNLPLTVKGVQYSARYPQNKKVKVYKTYDDLMAGKNAILIDVSKGLKIGVQCFEKTLKELSTTSDPSKYLNETRFNLYLFHNNEKYWHTYEPKESLFLYSHSTNEKTAAQLKELGLLELEINKLGMQASKNLYYVGLALKSGKLNNAQISRLVQSVQKQNAVLEKFKKETPKELKVLIKKSTIQMDGKITGIGIAPAVVSALIWAGSALVGAGVVVWGAVEIERERERTEKAKALLAQEGINISKIIEAAQLEQQGLVPPGTTKTVAQEVTVVNAGNQKALDNVTKNNPGLFTEVKSILIWGTAAFLAVKILPGLFNNKSK